MFLILSPDWICHELLVNNYSSSELCEELANRLQIVTDLSIFTDSPLFLLVFTSREKMSAIVSCYKHIQTFANKSFYIYGLLSEHSVHTSVRFGWQVHYMLFVEVSTLYGEQGLQAVREQQCGLGLDNRKLTKRRQEIKTKIHSIEEAHRFFNKFIQGRVD